MFLPIILAATVLLSPSRSTAAVQIKIFQDGADTVAEAIGALDLPPSVTIAHCGGTPGLFEHGAIAPAISAICLGPAQAGFAYRLTGPTTFGLGLGKAADASSGTFFGINGNLGLLAVSNPDVNSRSIWYNTTLADLGLQPGSLASWQVNDQEIKMAATPAPLPILASLGLFSWARKLRSRYQ